MKEITVGIDLGTTYSVVAAFNESTKQIDVLKNKFGKLTTPSALMFEKGKVLIGEEAKQYIEAGDENTASYYKSAMGNTAYSMQFNGKEYTPEALSRVFLTELKREVEQANGVKINKAVITVPAYFGEAAKTATLNAGVGAGFDVLKIINEPTAAILAYGLTGGEKTVMVYDLGGGTFDVTIARIKGTQISVLTTNGNHQLGGLNWDTTLIEEARARFRDDYGIDVIDYPSAYRELLVRGENAKKKLSELDSTDITVTCEGRTGKYTVTRARFEEVTAALLEETNQLIELCFKELGHGFGWKSLDEVVLVGGSTRMSQVKRMIVGKLGKEPVTKNINVDTIVAAGAALQAQLCEKEVLILPGSAYSPSYATLPGGDDMLTLRGSEIEDITSHSLGMLAVGKGEGTDAYVNSIIIPKNSKVNVFYDREYTFDGKALETYILQGESANPYDAELLYKYTVTGMRAGGQTDIKMRLKYNLNGVVDVEATSGGSPLKVTKERVTEGIDSVIDRLLRRREQTGGSANVKICVDTSGSMASSVNYVTALDMAKKALKDFISALDLQSNSISIINFSDRSEVLCEFTNNVHELETAIESLRTGGSTGYGNLEVPISKHAKDYPEDGRAKVFIVLTDGCWVHPASEVKASNAARANGINIFAVGFGSANEQFLKEIASYNSGKKIDIGDLSKTFISIAATIAKEK